MAKDQLKLIRTTKYPLEAFLFVQRGLDFTVRRIHGEPSGETDQVARHVTGQALCLGLRDYAIKQYGLLAKPVLTHWNIKDCSDFGHIVFALVDAALMHKTEEDSIQDFTDVYDFDEAFDSGLQLSENN